MDSAPAAGYDSPMANDRDRSIPVRTFSRAIDLSRGRRPLAFATRAKRPNAASLNALKDAEARRGLTRYDDFDDFARAMTGE